MSRCKRGYQAAYIIEWLRATFTYVTFRVNFSSMSESTHTSQADPFYVKRCVVYSLQTDRKTWHTGMKVPPNPLSVPPNDVKRNLAVFCRSARDVHMPCIQIQHCFRREELCHLRDCYPEPFNYCCGTLYAKQTWTPYSCMANRQKSQSCKTFSLWSNDWNWLHSTARFGHTHTKELFSTNHRNTHSWHCTLHDETSKNDMLLTKVSQPKIFA